MAGALRVKVYVSSASPSTTVALRHMFFLSVFFRRVFISLLYSAVGGEVTGTAITRRRC